MVKRGVRVLKRKNNAFIIWVIVILAALVVLGIILSSREPQFSPSPSLAPPRTFILPATSCYDIVCDMINQLTTRMTLVYYVSLTEGEEVYESDYFAIPTRDGCGKLLRLINLDKVCPGSSGKCDFFIETEEVITPSRRYSSIAYPNPSGEGFLGTLRIGDYDYSLIVLEDVALPFIKLDWPLFRRGQPTEIFTSCRAS